MVCQCTICVCVCCFIILCPEEALVLEPRGSWTMVGCEWRLCPALLPGTCFSLLLMLTGCTRCSTFVQS